MAQVGFSGDFGSDREDNAAAMESEEGRPKTKRNGPLPLSSTLFFHAMRVCVSHQPAFWPVYLAIQYNVWVSLWRM